MPRKLPTEFEVMGRELLIGLRSVAQKAIAKGVASVAEDARGLAREADARFTRFIEGCEEIARQGRAPDDNEPEAPTTRQTPRSKKGRTR